MSDKPKFPAAQALDVARELVRELRPCCEQNPDEGREFLVVAGSLRRHKEMVGDIEMVYVPKWGEVPDGLLTKSADLVEHCLDGLIERGILAKRKTSRGSETWGPKNKLAVHVASGIPVDFFANRPAHWYNYLVCRTGPAESNTAIATAALNRGLAWHPYHAGFTVEDVGNALKVWPENGLQLSKVCIFPNDLRTGRMLAVQSEADVFRLAGLPVLQPHQR